MEGPFSKTCRHILISDLVLDSYSGNYTVYPTKEFLG